MELCMFFLSSFSLSGSSDFRTRNFHLHEAETWGGKQQIYSNAKAGVYHGGEVSADPWTQTEQSIFSW